MQPSAAPPPLLPTLRSLAQANQAQGNPTAGKSLGQSISLRLPLRVSSPPSPSLSSFVLHQQIQPQPPNRQRSRPAQKPQPENPPYRNFVDPRCLRPSLSCKRPLRAVAGGSSLSRPPGRGLQSSSSPSSTITDERFAQPLPLPELEHAPSESLSLQRSILPPARSTTGRLRHPSIYQLQSAVVGRPYLPVRPHSQLPGTCAPPNV